jgi:hypothetical protein
LPAKGAKRRERRREEGRTEGRRWTAGFRLVAVGLLGRGGFARERREETRKEEGGGKDGGREGGQEVDR